MKTPAPHVKAKARLRRERLEQIKAQRRAGTLTVRKFWGPVKDEAAAAKRRRRQEMLDA